VLNLCANRYLFMVGFAAAVLRGQTSLLPPNSTPDLIARLARRYADSYCLIDTAAEHAGLETIVCRRPAVSEFSSRAAPMIAEAQLAAIAFTSGSTGDPVPHGKTWKQLVRSARVEAERLGIDNRLSVLGTVPPQHMYGFESTVLLAMQSGMRLHSGRPFFPEDVCAELRSLPRPRGMVTTPIHLRALLAETLDLPPVDFLLCATAPLAPQLAAEAEQRFGAPLYEIYGCTEAGQVATRRTVETLSWKPFSGVSLRRDEKGVWAHGGHVEPEAILRDVIEFQGPEAFLVHGRTSDLINIAGKRTSLANLNYHLNSIKGVRDGAFVMPEEDETGTTRLMAFVVAPELSGDAILSELRRRIDPVFLPRPIHFVEDLPRNETGKLPQKAVAELASRLTSKVQ
jgi:acyl-coenzyme A synthetase/AMP-(fatty) acid ligase